MKLTRKNLQLLRDFLAPTNQTLETFHMIKLYLYAPRCDITYFSATCTVDDVHETEIEFETAVLERAIVNDSVVPGIGSPNFFKRRC